MHFGANFVVKVVPILYLRVKLFSSQVQIKENESYTKNKADTRQQVKALFGFLSSHYKPGYREGNKARISKPVCIFRNGINRGKIHE